MLKRLREYSNIPVMILSAKNQDADKILGLDLGADDYLAKPFNPMEAMARINSNIRRFYSLGAKSEKLKQLEVKDLRLDTEACVVYRNDRPIDLTSVEYKMMRMFMEYPGKVFTKQQIYEEVWGKSMQLRTTTLWSASAVCARNFLRTETPILRRSRVLGIVWRKNKHEYSRVEKIFDQAVSSHSGFCEPQ